jgi:hypothetical protein
MNKMLKFTIGWEGVAGFVWLTVCVCKHDITYRIQVKLEEFISLCTSSCGTGTVSVLLVQLASVQVSGREREKKKKKRKLRFLGPRLGSRNFPRVKRECCTSFLSQ